MNPGIHTMSAEDYHADPCAVPSLTASIAAILTSQSPLHAWTAHPRLNPNYTREVSDKFDLGTVAHALLLEGESAAEVLDFPDWRTKDAKEAREAARAAGRIPLLSKHWANVETMVSAVNSQLDALPIEPRPFTDGKPEQTLIWEEDGGVVCRARLDWLRDDLTLIEDLKTTARSANPEGWSRNLYGIGSDVQAAFYLRGLRTIYGLDGFQGPMILDPAFRWIVCESTPPYALSINALGPAALALAEAKVEAAIKVWRECLEADHWPGYPQTVCYADLPGWEEARWLERQETHWTVGAYVDPGDEPPF
jgi:hypothetical protein